MQVCEVLTLIKALFWTQSFFSLAEEFSFFPLEVLQTAGERALSQLIPSWGSCCCGAEGFFKQSLCLQR